MNTKESVSIHTDTLYTLRKLNQLCIRLVLAL